MLLNKDTLTSGTLTKTPSPPNLAVCVLGSCPCSSDAPITHLKLGILESLLRYRLYPHTRTRSWDPGKVREARRARTLWDPAFIIHGDVLLMINFLL